MNIDEQNDEEKELLEAQSRNPFDHGSRSFNFARRRVTDCKGNSRVIFPRKTRSPEEESALETLRTELQVLFRNYVRTNCQKGGGCRSQTCLLDNRGALSH